MADMLATPEDLASLLQSDTVDASTATMLLELATGVIQAAVGQRIVDATTTGMVLMGVDDQWLDLPQRPVRSVSNVTLDGVTITDWRLRGQRLWRLPGWQAYVFEPSEITLDSEHGYLAGSQDLQLARNACLSLAQAGYGNPTGVKAESIDDYRVTYAEAMERMVLGENLRAALVNAYGLSAYITQSRQ
jgi:hypothetical protein